MATSRNGFIPAHPCAPDMVTNVPVGAGGVPVSKGDAVNMINGLCYACTAGQDPSQYGYGVVLAVYTTANRPLTFQSTKFIASGAVGRADVCFDPNMTYYVQCVTSVGQSNIGKNVMIDASAANATLGISGMAVDIPASSSVNDLFKVINAGPFDMLGGPAYTQVYAQGATNNGVLVRWNRHFLKAPVANQ